MTCVLAGSGSGEEADSLLLLQAFTVFVNKNLKSPEYISLFVDENLRKGLKGVSFSFSPSARDRKSVV